MGQRDKAVDTHESHQVTRLLARWRDGDLHAAEELLPLVYEELRRIAHRHMKEERADHTLPATALVHEAYSRLVRMDIEWSGRVHFLAVAARAMRRILVDHARARGRQRRGGGWAKLSLEDTALLTPEPSEQLVALDEALMRLEQLDVRKARAIELHYFGGLDQAETAEALEISTATLTRDLRFARAWLYRELGGEGDGGA
jgi:RNA polymerase sigma factor (TIGR02999 family)